MSAAAYKAISRALRAGKDTVLANSLWLGIHSETGLGRRNGRSIVFSHTDLEALRRYGESLGGVDPLHNTLEGSRIDVAAITPDEKYSADSVFGDLLVIATLGSACVPLRGEHASTSAPAGIVLSVPIGMVDVERLSHQKLLIVENGAILPVCDRLCLPPQWTNTLVLYRGHRENAKHVKALIHAQPTENLGMLYDFDPAGLSMAMTHNKGTVLIPDPSYLTDIDSALLARINQPRLFHRQHEQCNQLTRSLVQEGWKSVLGIMVQRRLAVTQENMVAGRIPIIAVTPEFIHNSPPAASAC